MTDCKDGKLAVNLHEELRKAPTHAEGVVCAQAVNNNKDIAVKDRCLYCDDRLFRLTANYFHSMVYGTRKTHDKFI